MEARAALSYVRRCINEFRDAQWEKLVRARNNLIKTMTVAGIVAYGLLVLAVIMEAPEHTILAGAAFFGVGAAIGLADQLRWEGSQSTNQTTTQAVSSDMEDYGYATARLIHIPLLSGLVAVIGVAFMAMFPVVFQNAVPAPRSGAVAMAAATPAVATPAAATVIPAPDGRHVPLTDIFDVNGNSFGFVFAVAFGLVPSWLLDRIRQQARKYAGDLAATEAPTNIPAAT